ncbi:hypothetical protein IMCC14465_15800 [alpha proteobacterium IMCC14465]|uniref:BolA family transcriptional regulator n=1 Tax=alpha proteobacterium IMCC14465 TaxID=1220535 RepID=J9DEY1_9PROT|nr:hypothetical protein IMCC14465_15800 [alpha proteobacterium IMCC14465]
MAVVDMIIKKLEARFAPEYLNVTDESHRHKGHAGSRPGGETHFWVKITSSHFDGLSRIERHRLINDCLCVELKGLIHALTVKAKTPAEAAEAENK